MRLWIFHSTQLWLHCITFYMWFFSVYVFSKYSTNAVWALSLTKKLSNQYIYNFQLVVSAYVFAFLFINYFQVFQKIGTGLFLLWRLLRVSGSNEGQYLHIFLRVFNYFRENHRWIYFVGLGGSLWLMQKSTNCLPLLFNQHFLIAL